MMDLLENPQTKNESKKHNKKTMPKKRIHTGT